MGGRESNRRGGFASRTWVSRWLFLGTREKREKKQGKEGRRRRGASQTLRALGPHSGQQHADCFPCQKSGDAVKKQHPQERRKCGGPGGEPRLEEFIFCFLPQRWRRGNQKTTAGACGLPVAFLGGKEEKEGKRRMRSPTTPPSRPPSLFGQGKGGKEGRGKERKEKKRKGRTVDMAGRPSRVKPQLPSSVLLLMCTIPVRKRRAKVRKDSPSNAKHHSPATACANLSFPPERKGGKRRWGEKGGKGFEYCSNHWSFPSEGGGKKRREGRGGGKGDKEQFAATPSIPVNDQCPSSPNPLFFFSAEWEGKREEERKEKRKGKHEWDRPPMPGPAATLLQPLAVIYDSYLHRGKKKKEKEREERSVVHREQVPFVPIWEEKRRRGRRG